jgi:Uma2 family endonuclease
MSIEELELVEELEQLEQEEQKVVSGLHGVIGTRLVRILGNYVEDNSLGYVVGDNVDFDIPGLGTKTKKPDGAYFNATKSPYVDDVLPFAPDLAIEVFSQTDGWKNTLKKARLYLKAGTKLVWIIDPYTKSVLVFRPNEEIPARVSGDTELSGEGAVLPDFKLKLSKLFEGVVIEDLLEETTQVSDGQ